MYDILGNKQISWLKTFVFWREHTKNFSYLENEFGTRFPTKSQYLNGLTGSPTGTCPLCNGLMVWRDEENHERYRCLCLLLDKIQEMDQRFYRVRTSISRRTLDEMVIRGATQSEKKSVSDAIAAAKNFLANPGNWLVLIGGIGNGKTHIMQAIAREFGPFALYLSEGDFESSIFEAMNNNNLPNLMWRIERAPVLLFDDFGAGYGSDLVKSKFRQVVDWRYNQYPEYPLVISTNLTPRTIYSTYEREGSRILDKSRSFICMITAGDYRQEVR